MAGQLNVGDWNAIVRTLRDGDGVVPFLGAGASLGFAGPSLPTGGELAKILAGICQYPGVEQEDFLRVCQYYELWSDPQELRREIVQQISVKGAKPGAIHQTLASFPLTHVLTTNYDRFMETAFQDAGKSPKVIVHDAFSTTAPKVPAGTEKCPVVYKLHGELDNPPSMICTEDDVIQFLARLLRDDPPLPESVKALFESRPFLFIGYGLRDWNIRVLLRAMRPRNRQGYIKSYAIQRRPTDEGLAQEWDRTVIYWDKRENITCYDYEAREFLTMLGNLYNRRSAPQPAGAGLAAAAPGAPPRTET